jgi:alpha-galactosidase
LWRTTGDIEDTWESIIKILDLQAGLESYAGPGHWNDPDMLEVGNGGLTFEESKAHFSLWCLLAAPLMAGNDLRSMTKEAAFILTNKDVIAVDQDKLGVQGRRLRKDGSVEVWVKPLTDGSKAVVLLNRGLAPAIVSVSWKELGVETSTAEVRDLWLRSDQGRFLSGYLAKVPSHGVVMVKVKASNIVL